MLKKHKAVLLFLSLQALIIIPIHGQDPVLWWKFDTITNGTLTEEVGSQQDIVKGYHRLVQGVKGNALKLDGYTTSVIRDAAKVPDFNDGLAIEAWIALQALPWNWSGIVSQGGNIILPITPGPEYEHKIFFGVDAHGHLGFKLNINRQLYECVSEEKLPLLKWSHAAATFDPNEGMKIYINGDLAAELKVQGTITDVPGTDLLLGMNIQELGPVGSERQASADIQSKMVIHGLLDEVKIYDNALATDFIKESCLTNKPSEIQPLTWRRMPSGPEFLLPRFDGFYTRLMYTDEWEAPRRESDHPDILIHFDQLPVRLIFWRGTNYGASWVTENGLWMGEQSVERAGGGKSPLGCSEHMSDKQSRYGNVRIIEKNDARIVVQWRYAIADIIYDIFGTNIGTVNNTGDGWGEWAEEYYYIYPDGVSTRHQTLWTEYLSHEFQETIVLNHPGTYPEDNIEIDALTLANMDGDYRTYSWENDIELMREVRSKGEFLEPEKPNIQVVNLKSQYKPFIIFEPNPRIAPFNPNTIRPGYSHFPWWNHWPVGQLPNDGRRAFGPDRASHSSLSQSVEGSEVIHNMGDGSYEVVTLVGMTDKPAASLAMLARSWNNAPELIVQSNDFNASGHSKKERAFIISNNNKAPASEVKFTLSATENSPVVNPSFVIKNWGDADVELTVNGEKLSRGDSFRYGFRKTLQGTDLVLWIELRSDAEVSFTLNSQKELGVMFMDLSIETGHVE
jgi:hypothetical protein